MYGGKPHAQECIFQRSRPFKIKHSSLGQTMVGPRVTTKPSNFHSPEPYCYSPWKIRKPCDDPREVSITRNSEEEPITEDPKKDLSRRNQKKALSLRNLKRTPSLTTLRRVLSMTIHH